MLGKTNSKAANVLPCEYVNIVLVTNQPSHEDAVGAVVNVNYEDFNEDYVWEGKDLTVKIPEGVEYTVSFGDVDGYASPSAVSYKAVADNSRDIVVVYRTEVVTVVVSADDGGTASAQVTVDGVTYTGSEIRCKVPFGRVYEVVPGEVSGYVTPASQSFTADSASREVSVVYVSSSLTVEILSNQADDLVIGAVRATVTYGDVSVQLANGEKVVIPMGSEVTVSFPEVEGYRSPDAAVYTHTGGDVVKSGTYETELVTVNVTADQGTVTGFEVTLKDSSTGAVIATQTTAVETYKIPFGDSYSVVASSVDGFVTPASQIFVAEQDSRVVSVMYEKITHTGTTTPGNGVWIQDTDGYCHTVDEWDGTYTPNGIAVITSNCRFVMALENAYSSICQWGNYQWSVSNVVTTSSKQEAKVDYNGQSNTEGVIAYRGESEAPAARYCKNYTFPDGSTGYLGAAGEWQAALDNKAAVMSALSKCGGTAMSHWYWTSTQYSFVNSWYMQWSDELLSYESKNDNSCVRAFAAI